MSESKEGGREREIERKEVGPRLSLVLEVDERREVEEEREG